MRTVMKFAIQPLAIVSLGAVLLGASAPPPPPPQPPPSRVAEVSRAPLPRRLQTMERRLTHDLDLTRDQRRELHDLLEERADEFIEASRQVVEAGKQLREAILNGAAEEHIREVSDALGDAAGDLAALGAGILDELRGMLNERQLKRLERIVERTKERGGPLSRYFETGT